MRIVAFQLGIEDVCRIRFEIIECRRILPCAGCAHAILRALNRGQPDACGGYLRRRRRGGSALRNLRHGGRRAGNDDTLCVACAYGDCDCRADIAFNKSISRAGCAGYVFAGARPLIRERSQSYCRRRCKSCRYGSQRLTECSRAANRNRAAKRRLADDYCGYLRTDCFRTVTCAYLTVVVIRPLGQTGGDGKCRGRRAVYCRAAGIAVAGVGIPLIVERGILVCGSRRDAQAAGDDAFRDACA